MASLSSEFLLDVASEGTSKGLESRSRFKSGYLFFLLPLCGVSAVWLSSSRRIHHMPQTFWQPSSIAMATLSGFWWLFPPLDPSGLTVVKIPGVLHHALLVFLHLALIVVNSPFLKLASFSLFECAIGFLLDPWLLPCPFLPYLFSELHIIQAPATLWGFPDCSSLRKLDTPPPLWDHFLQHSVLTYACLSHCIFSFLWQKMKLIHHSCLSS